MAHIYMVTHDNALDQQMDEVIEVIAKVSLAYASGYDETPKWAVQLR